MGVDGRAEAQILFSIGGLLPGNDYHACRYLPNETFSMPVVLGSASSELNHVFIIFNRVAMWPFTSRALTEDDIEIIAEKAAEKQFRKMTDHVYQEVGKGLINRFCGLSGCVYWVGNMVAYQRRFEFMKILLSLVIVLLLSALQS